MLQSYKAQLHSGYWESLRPKQNTERMQNLEAAVYQQRTELSQQRDMLVEQSNHLRHMTGLMEEQARMTAGIHQHLSVASSAGEFAALMQQVIDTNASGAMSAHCWH